MIRAVSETPALPPRPQQPAARRSIRPRRHRRRLPRASATIGWARSPAIVPGPARAVRGPPCREPSGSHQENRSSIALAAVPGSVAPRQHHPHPGEDRHQRLGRPNCVTRNSGRWRGVNPSAASRPNCLVKVTQSWPAFHQSIGATTTRATTPPAHGHGDASQRRKRPWKTKRQHDTPSPRKSPSEFGSNAKAGRQGQPAATTGHRRSAPAAPARAPPATRTVPTARRAWRTCRQ